MPKSARMLMLDLLSIFGHRCFHLVQLGAELLADEADAQRHQVVGGAGDRARRAAPATR